MERQLKRHFGKGILIGALTSQAIVLAAPVYAGPYTDELSKCLVRTTSDDDKTHLVQWFFSMISLHPKVKEFAAISDEQRLKFTKDTSLMFQRLLTESCLGEARQAIKYEGKAAFEASFSVLGGVATRALFTDPNVTAGLAELDKYVDKKRFKEILESPE